MNNIKEDIYSKYISELNDLKESDSFRSFITHAERDKKYIYINGKKYLNLSSNDYLGLSSDRELINEFYSKMKCGKGFHQEFMLGSSSSRSLTADSVIHNELETELSQLYHNEVLLFNSGYHANIGIIPAVTTREDLILTDKLNHASIIDGSRLSFAKCLKYDHLNYENLEDFLKRHRDRYKNVIIVSESLFSMNGDIADIKKLVELKQKYNCLLYIDEAHSAGVFGTDGLGICKENDIIKEIDFVVVTFGKAFGSYGAFVVTKKVFKEYLINKMRSLIFTTALPPVIINWSLFIIRKIADFKDRREKLFALSKEFRQLFENEGLDIRGSSYIIPVIIGKNDGTLKMSKILKENGFYCMPIRPPTVPDGSARIRISLTSEIDLDDIRRIPKIIKENL